MMCLQIGNLALFVLILFVSGRELTRELLRSLLMIIVAHDQIFIDSREG